jgi:hypothetical protein
MDLTNLLLVDRIVYALVFMLAWLLLIISIQSLKPEFKRLSLRQKLLNREVLLLVIYYWVIVVTEFVIYKRFQIAYKPSLGFAAFLFLLNFLTKRREV